MRSKSGAVVQHYETPPMTATERELKAFLSAENPGLAITVMARPARMVKP